MPYEMNIFPTYSKAEVAADAVVHVLGISLGVGAVIWLLLSAWQGGSPGARTSFVIYGFGLIGMLCASAAYNMTPACRAKELLRRFDHAMIYVMIAGTYTPFALLAVGGVRGAVLCAIIWSAALAGIVLKVGFPRRFEWAGFALYLGMGWMVVAVIDRVFAALSSLSFTLLLAGGVVYTLGSGIHLMQRLRFHNALWHTMVLAAAAAHFIAIAGQFAVSA